MAIVSEIVSGVAYRPIRFMGLKVGHKILLRGDQHAWSVMGIEHRWVGDISMVSVFGQPVYERVGNVRSLFGFVWGEN